MKGLHVLLLYIWKQRHWRILKGLRSSGKYFLKNSFLNLIQVTTSPLASILILVPAHQYAASSASMCVANLTFWSSLVTIARKILFMPCVQVKTPSGSNLPLNVGWLFLMNTTLKNLKNFSTVSSLFIYSLKKKKLYSYDRLISIVMHEVELTPQTTKTPLMQDLLFLLLVVVVLLF